MQRRFVVIIVIALVVGTLASALVYRVVSQVQTVGPRDTSVPIVVAAVNIGLAETITEQHVKVVPWPKASVPPGAIVTVAQSTGRVARSFIVAGEPIVDGKLAPQLAGRGGIMPMLVREGQRAVTIKVDDATRETGFILPNSKVDVLVSMQSPAGSGQEKIAKIILQDVQVLAAGQVVEIRDNKPVQMTTVTMALTPEQTERLTLAQTEGRLFLVTRNMNDKTIVQTRGATKATLLSDAAPAADTPRPARPVAAKAPLAPPKLDTATVTVLHGTKATEHRFLRTGERDWVERGAERP
jgi:pilus assembly protein CpaB